jgi:hypothetical protein
MTVKHQHGPGGWAAVRRAPKRMKPFGIAAAPAALAFTLMVSPSVAQEWEFSVTPYFWGSGLEGDIGAFPNLPTVEVDLSFGDILEDLEGAIMIKGEAQRGRFGLIMDLAYVKTDSSSDNVSIRDPRFTGATLENEMVTATFAGAWRLVEEEQYSIDLVGGVRYAKVSPDLTLFVRDAAVRRANPDESWFDPVIGARTKVQLSPRWSVAAYGDVGGFGVSSDLTWQALATASYAFNEQWAVSAGWRHYAVDYEEDGFVYDIAQNGPILGVTFRW